jgi:hypothetical protein
MDSSLGRPQSGNKSGDKTKIPTSVGNRMLVVQLIDSPVTSNPVVRGVITNKTFKVKQVLAAGVYVLLGVRATLENMKLVAGLAPSGVNFDNVM